ncbi:MAG: hypothetical protein QNJ63_19240 [Calothrix sp. MO_192.B10]|nr:hypothetical protein [Calothrix sp. MO_192.B10]
MIIIPPGENNWLWARRYSANGIKEGLWVPCPYYEYVGRVIIIPPGGNNRLWARRYSSHLGEIIGCGHGDIQPMALRKDCGCRAPTMNMWRDNHPIWGK